MRRNDFCFAATCSQRLRFQPDRVSALKTSRDVGLLFTWEAGGKKGRIAQEGERACILFPCGPGIDLSSLSDRVQEGHFALASVG